MCGIAGVFSSTAASTVMQEAAVRSMTSAIRHRGPDGDGHWCDGAAGIALGHRRLAVVELSEAGAQPMRSWDGRFVLTFNGEIYNHLELRAELELAHATPGWRGHSDTETLLAGFAHWGVEATLQRTVGMFALALWDSRESALHLARDRFGEKPLYYGWSAGAFIFGSELKALRAYPGFANPVSVRALGLYLRYLYVPAPHAIFDGVYKLEPGTLLSIRGRPPVAPPVDMPSAPGVHQNMSIVRWWSLAQSLNRPGGADSSAEYLEELERRLEESIRLQSLADVPLGAFLSGGVDSSTIVALMQRQSAKPIQTFTVSFDDPSYDESSHAERVARHLGTRHTTVPVTAADARSLIPALPIMYDEPFADSSQLPTHLVCRSARREVTVALSGDAGDEIFGGYNRYVWAPRLWNSVRRIPGPLRHILGEGMCRVPARAYDRFGSTPSSAGALQLNALGHKAHKLADALRHSSSRESFYLSLVSTWMRPESLLQNSAAAWIPSREIAPQFRAELGSFAEQMMWQDTHSYMPDDVLCKVDRAAMAVSLETRAPFLDHRLVDWAWRMPLELRIKEGQTKWALRQILYRYVPATLIERPKAGFAVPVGEWLRGPLREWAEELLHSDRLQREGFLQPAPIRAAWRQHLAGSQMHAGRLWGVLMFQSWLENLTMERTGRRN